jgi:hypothetical protein
VVRRETILLFLVLVGGGDGGRKFGCFGQSVVGRWRRYIEEKNICSRDVYIIVFRDSVVCGGKVEYGSVFATKWKKTEEKKQSGA